MLLVILNASYPWRSALFHKFFRTFQMVTWPHFSLDAVGDLQERLARAGEGRSVCLLQPAAQGQLPLESFGQSGFTVATF